MAIGGLAALVLTDWLGEVTRGFLRLCAGLVAPLALMASLVPGARPAPVGMLGALLLLCSLAYFVLQLRSGAERPRRLVGLAGTLEGAILLALLGWGAAGGRGAPGMLLAVILADTLVIGSAGVGLVLGHWYLVTPRLSARPLRRLVDLLLVGLVLEALVALGPLLAGGGASGGPGPIADVLVWGRLSALVVLPAAMAVAARACCREWPRGRALQAATGLLYVATGSVLGGVMLGNLLRFGPPSVL